MTEEEKTFQLVLFCSCALKWEEISEEIVMILTTPPFIKTLLPPLLLVSPVDQEQILTKLCFN